jgi:hypothetical protein
VLFGWVGGPRGKEFTGAQSISRLIANAARLSRGRCCHLHAPHSIPFVFPHAKYSERRLHDGRSRGLGGAAALPAAAGALGAAHEPQAVQCDGGGG